MEENCGIFIDIKFSLAFEMIFYSIHFGPSLQASYLHWN